MAWGARHLISASPSGLLENEKMKEKPNYFVRAHGDEAA